MDIAFIGDCVRDARCAHGLTQREVARRSGVSRNTVSAIENNSFGDLGIRKIERVCAILHLCLSVGPCLLESGGNQTEAVAAAEEADRRVAMAMRRKSAQLSP